MQPIRGPIGRHVATVTPHRSDLHSTHRLPDVLAPHDLAGPDDLPVDLPAMVEHVLLRREGTHAVPHQDEWAIGVLLLGDTAQPHHVLHQQIKAALPEISEMGRGGYRAAVSAVIVSVDSQAG